MASGVFVFVLRRLGNPTCARTGRAVPFSRWVLKEEWQTRPLRAGARGLHCRLQVFPGISNGIVGLAPFGPDVTDEMAQTILARQQEIADGSFEVPAIYEEIE